MRFWLISLWLLLNSCSPKAPECGGVHSQRCLQIATFNLEFFPDGNQGSLSVDAREYKKSRIADIIQKNGLDIIALQEVDGNPAKMTAFVENYLRNEFNFILATSGPENQKIAVLYRKSVVIEPPTYRELTNQNSFGTIRSEKPHWLGRNRLPLEVFFKLRHSPLEFRLIALHLKSGSKVSDCQTRAEQVLDLANYLSKTPNSFILAGDFNDKLPGNGICENIDTLAPLEKLSKLNFVTQPGSGLPANAVTFIAEPYRSAIDHLALSSDLYQQVVPLYQWQAEVIAHENKRISDHHPVVFWLRLFDPPR